MLRVRRILPCAVSSRVTSARQRYLLRQRRLRTAWRWALRQLVHEGRVSGPRLRQQPQSHVPHSLILYTETACKRLTDTDLPGVTCLLCVAISARPLEGVCLQNK
jgi:hypothetical protein